jgi:hypothetical protein
VQIFNAGFFLAQIFVVSVISCYRALDRRYCIFRVFLRQNDFYAFSFYFIYGAHCFGDGVTECLQIVFFFAEPCVNYHVFAVVASCNRGGFRFKIKRFFVVFIQKSHKRFSVFGIKNFHNFFLSS